MDQQSADEIFEKILEMDDSLFESDLADEMKSKIARLFTYKEGRDIMLANLPDDREKLEKLQDTLRWQLSLAIDKKKTDAQRLYDERDNRDGGVWEECIGCNCNYVDISYHPATADRGDYVTYSCSNCYSEWDNDGNTLKYR